MGYEFLASVFIIIFIIFVFFLIILLAYYLKSDKNDLSSYVQKKKSACEAKKSARPGFIIEFGNYISTFPEGTKIYRSELEEKYKSHEQDLPDIFELNDYLHTINCEAAYAYDYYMIVPVGTIDFDEKKKISEQLLD